MTFFASADRESQEPPPGAMLQNGSAALNLKKSEPVVRSFPQDYAQWLDDLDYFSVQGALAREGLTA